MRIGLIGASIRPAAVALADTNSLAIGIDWFSDQETVEVLGSRSLVAKDIKHAKALVMQFSKSPRIRKRKIAPGFSWILAGGLDLQPDLIQTLTWSGSQILGCGLPAIELAKSIDRWAPQLGKIYPHVPRFQWLNAGYGRWHRKENWPASKKTAFWQQHIEGENRSAVFLAETGRAELIGVTRQFTTRACHPAGPYCYLGNEVLDLRDYENHLDSIECIGQWFAKEPEVAGVFGVDFIQNEHIWPIEINPRITASLEALAAATGINWWKRHVEAVRSRETVESNFECPTETHAEIQYSNETSLIAETANQLLTSCAQKTTESSPALTQQVKQQVTLQKAIKRIVYQIGSSLTIDERWIEKCNNLISHVRSRNDIDLRIMDRPKLGTTIHSGEPTCTLLVLSRPEQQISWSMTDAIENELTRTS